MLNKIKYIAITLCLVSCSMTKNIPEDDQLFVGLTKIAYSDEQKYTNEGYDKHLENTKLEVEAAWLPSLTVLCLVVAIILYLGVGISGYIISTAARILVSHVG